MKLLGMLVFVLLLVAIMPTIFYMLYYIGTNQTLRAGGCIGLAILIFYFLYYIGEENENM